MRYTLYKKLILSMLLACAFNVNTFANTIQTYSDYCLQSGGQVEEMVAEFLLSGRSVEGFKKPFCNVYLGHAFLSIGLETFASEKPNIAATLMKTLQPIKENSPLLKGNNPNPSHNVCKNLNGAAIGMVSSGGFANQYGQNDICVFGDGSMVSGWTLIYMANHREGYDDIKNKVKSEPINIFIPQ